MRWPIVCIIALALAKPDRPPQAPPKEVVNDLARLDGVWAVVSYEFDGGRLPEDQIANYPKLIIKNGSYRWTTTTNASPMKIDQAKMPKQVDYTLEGQVYHGIYELTGDIFRDCIAPPGRERPMDFTVPQGSGRMYFVYRRVNE